MACGEICNGVIAGIGSALVLQASYLFIKKVLVPEYIERANRVLDMSGQWVVRHEGNPADGENIETNSETRMNISQRGHGLSGTAEISYEGDIERREYEISGEVRNNFVLMYFTSKDRKNIGYQTYLIQMLESGKLDGYRTFYGSKMRVIRSIECCLDRVKT
jgi:hypothetical protein